MKKIQAFISLLLLVVFMSGCIFGDDDKASSNSSSSLIGTWEEQESYQERETITFDKDGTFYWTIYYTNPTEIDKIYGAYTISESIVTLTYHELGKEYVDKYVFLVSGNTLTMKSVFQDFTIKYIIDIAKNFIACVG